MAYEELELKKQKIANRLVYLPRKILTLHGQENVTEFVLHDLCHSDCFNLDKAAYFIDNPDFDCLKGVAGFSRSEAFSETDSSSIWDSPQSFSLHMSKAPFNQTVRNINRQSMRKSVTPDVEIAQLIAQDLGFKNHGFYSWDMKHNNHGILIYEQPASAEGDKEQLINGVTLLSFCPVF